MADVQTTAQPLGSQNPTGIYAWIKQHQLLVFFVLAFAFTWPFMLVDALGSYGLLPFRITLAGPGVLLVVLMGYGPTFSALAVTGATDGKAGIRALLRRLLIWRVGIQWYAAAILGTGFLFFLAAQLYALLGGTLRAEPPVSLGLIPLVMVSILAHGFLSGEELGWRGFALPRMQAGRGALSASLLLGVPWFLFHLPLFITMGGGVGGNQANESVLAFLLQALAASVLVTWLYNNAQGSVLLAILFHGAVNTWPDLFGGTSGPLAWLQAGVFCVAAVAVVVVFGAAHLSRKPVSVLPPPVASLAPAVTAYQRRPQA
jgi:membrane protease YdiL (CAAX protease family)